MFPTGIWILLVPCLRNHSRTARRALSIARKASPFLLVARKLSRDPAPLWGERRRSIPMPRTVRTSWHRDAARFFHPKSELDVAAEDSGQQQSLPQKMKESYLTNEFENNYNVSETSHGQRGTTDQSMIKVQHLHYRRFSLFFVYCMLCLSKQTLRAFKS
jgi:hypothetical protein